MHLTVQHGLHPFEGDGTVFHALVQIDEDRYGGCYSGAAFTAWPGVAPLDIGCVDGDCEAFWGLHADALHGKGSTPQQAFRDLLSRIKVSRRPWDPEDELKLVLVVGQEETTGFAYGSSDFYTWLVSDHDFGLENIGGHFCWTLVEGDAVSEQGPRLIDPCASA